jgi:hypothetical protein
MDGQLDFFESIKINENAKIYNWKTKLRKVYNVIEWKRLCHKMTASVV